MAKKAEAFKQYNDAAMASMVIDKLPELVQAAAQPLSKIGNVTLLSTGGDTTGLGKITADVLSVAAQGVTMVKGLTGIDLVDTMSRSHNDLPKNQQINNQAQAPQAPSPAPNTQNQQQKQPPVAASTPPPINKG
jgi:flotillin